MVANDILLINDDLTFLNGDFIVGESEQQHIEDIIRSAPGYWKQYPLVGVNITMFLNSAGMQQELLKQTKLQLIADGYAINKVGVSMGENLQLTITDAKRN